MKFDLQRVFISFPLHLSKMATLNLVVHSNDLKKYMKGERVPSVLERIDEVYNTDPNDTYFMNPGDIIHPEKYCEGYSSVILFGYQRRLCVATVARNLLKEGFIVSYDIEGTYQGYNKKR